MTQVSKLNISIVIPVYNDEKVIADCLRSIKKQKVKPYEIIIVDNNCTDKSISIVKRFKGVKIIKEYRQGQKYAQITGLNSAKGDILVRLDADTILPKNYISKAIEIFYNNSDIAAVTGYGISRYEFIPGTSRIWSWCYFKYTKAYFGYPILWGANMAIRTDYWRKASKHLILEDTDIHEDQDVSLALVSVGGKLQVHKDLEVSVEMEGVQHFGKYHHYIRMMRDLKLLDKNHRRYKLKTRLPKINIFVRIFYWLISAWSLYVFYLITIIYTPYWHVKRFMLAH